jgi:hypothetical protein
MFGVKYSPQCSDNKIVGFTKEDFSSYEEAESWLVEHHCCAECQTAWRKKQRGEELSSEEEVQACLAEWEIYDVNKYHKYMSYFDSVVLTIERFLELAAQGGLSERDLRECLQIIYDETQENLAYYTAQNDAQQMLVQADMLAAIEQAILNRE